jgi:uncharacterized protein YndB with AHSA1/START domain
MPNTVRLHRVLATKPEKIYRAFIEPDAMAKWLPPNGFTCTVHHMDPTAGGSHRMSFRNFTTGHSHSFGGQYVELVPNERLRYTDKFDDPKRSSTGKKGGESVTARRPLPIVRSGLKDLHSEIPQPAIQPHVPRVELTRRVHRSRPFADRRLKSLRRRFSWHFFRSNPLDNGFGWRSE